MEQARIKPSNVDIVYMDDIHTYICVGVINMNVVEEEEEVILAARAPRPQPRRRLLHGGNERVLGCRSKRAQRTWRPKG
jgi:hypothetical protein